MAAFSHLLGQTVTVAERSGLGSGGDPTYASTSELDARVEQKTQVVVTADGDTRQAQHIVYTDTAIGMGARVWIPGADTGDANEAKRPIETRVHPTPDGSTVLYETLV